MSSEILQKMNSGQLADCDCQVSGFQNWSENLDPKKNNFSNRQISKELKYIILKTKFSLN